MMKRAIICFTFVVLLLMVVSCAPQETIVIKGQVVSIQAHKGWTYDTTTIVLASGNTTMEFTIRSSVPLGVGETYTFRMWSVDDEYVLESVVQAGSSECR